MNCVIQVAGVSDVDEALACFAAGADIVGIPLRLALHQQDLSEEGAASMVREVHARNPALAFAVITYEDDAQAAATLCRHVGAQVLQLHAAMTAAAGQALRELLPETVLIKSLVIGNKGVDAVFAEMEAHATWADAFLTDTFDPITGALGATGRTHDWTVGRMLMEASPKPLMLAGGLRPGNVAQAIATVAPAGVDAHTGLEDAAKRKDWQRVTAFVAAARRAFAQLDGPACAFPNLRPGSNSGTHPQPV